MNNIKYKNGNIECNINKDSNIYKVSKDHFLESCNSNDLQDAWFYLYSKGVLFFKGRLVLNAVDNLKFCKSCYALTKEFLSMETLEDFMSFNFMISEYLDLHLRLNLTLDEYIKKSEDFLFEDYRTRIEDKLSCTIREYYKVQSHDR